jgi:hypothetical protein
MGKRNAHRILDGKSERMSHLADLGIQESVILK